MTTPQMLADRYGTRPARRWPIILGAVLAVGLLLYLSWITISSAAKSVDVDDLGFEVADDGHSVTIRFQVTAPSSRDVRCALEALDEEFGIVGWRIVEYPATESTSQSHTETIPTVGRATTGLVNSCWFA